MDDLLSIVLIVVLYFVLKPVVKAVFRGFGSSDHRRDRSPVVHNSLTFARQGWIDSFARLGFYCHFNPNPAFFNYWELLVMR